MAKPTELTELKKEFQRRVTSAEIGGVVGFGLWQLHFSSWSSALGASMLGFALFLLLGEVTYQLLVIADALHEHLIDRK